MLKSIKGQALWSVLCCLGLVGLLGGCSTTNKQIEDVLSTEPVDSKKVLEAKPKNSAQTATTAIVTPQKVQKEKRSSIKVIEPKMMKQPLENIVVAPKTPKLPLGQQAQTGMTLKAEQTPTQSAKASHVIVKEKKIYPEKPAGQEDLFVVTAGPKDQSHPYYNVGSKLGMIVNGVQGKELILIRGKTYRFKIETGVQHDFYISSVAKGWGAATVTEGVTGNFTYRGIVSVTPTSATPSTVYYACRNHKNMGARIHVVAPGDETKVVLGKPAQKNRPRRLSKSGKNSSVDMKRVSQKVSFADMFINQSSAAKRIEGSNNAKAIEIYRSAQNLLLSSKGKIASNADAAMAGLDKALKLMAEATRLVPSVSQINEQKKRFAELMKGVKTFQKSYVRNYERMVKKKGTKNVVRLNIDETEKMINKAQALADQGDFVRANKTLSNAQSEITSILSKMLNDETMSYDIVFATPKEEFEYELARFESYLELIPIAIEQKRPPKQTEGLMWQFVDKAKGIKDQSGPEAKRKNYKTAILMLQGATSHLQKALKIVGVR